MKPDNCYEGPRFTAHDVAGTEYTLTPVYRCREDDDGRPIGDGYGADDLLRLWTSTGETARYDGPGEYTILSSNPPEEIALSSRHPKAI